MTDLSNYTDADLANAAGIALPSSVGAGVPIPAQHAQQLSTADLQAALGGAPQALTANLGTANVPDDTSGFIGHMANAARGMVGNIAAGMQMTSPVVIDAKGNYNRQKLGEIGQDDTGQAVIMGQGQFNPKTMVALTDPATGKLTAFARNQDTDTGKLASLGHIIGNGTMTTAPETGAISAAANAEAPTMASRLASFNAAGVNPTVGDITQSAPIQIAQNLLKNIPGASGPMAKAANTQLAQLASKADEVAGSFGSAANPVDAGQSLQNGLNNYADRFMQQSGNNYAAIPIDPQTPAVLDNTKEALGGLTAKIQSNPDIAQILQNPTFQKLQTALDGNGLSYGDLRQLRTFIGPKAVGRDLTSDVPTSDWKNLYGALSDDLNSTASAVSPEAAQAAQAANDFHRQGMQTMENYLNPLSKASSPENAYSRLITAAGQGGTANIAQVQAVKDALTPDEFGNLTSTYIRQMGQPKAGDPFSPAKFVTSYNKLSPQARDVMFGAAGTPPRAQVDALANVSSFMKGTEKLANHSGSANHGLMGAGAMAIMENPEHAYPVIAASLAGNVGGRLLTSPSLARGLASMGSSLPSASAVAGPAMRALPAPYALQQIGRIPGSLSPFGPLAEPQNANQ